MNPDAVANARSVRTEWAQWDLTTEAWPLATRISTEEFRPDGKIAASESHWNGKLISRCAYSYDDAGVLMETKLSLDDGTSYRTVHEYEDGRLARIAHYDTAGSRTVSEERVYAADGSYKCTRQFPKERGGRDIFCPVAGLNLYLSARGATTMITWYHREDHPSEATLQTADGEVLRRVVVQHDDAGHLVKAEVLQYDEPLLGRGAATTTIEHKYDHAGRQIETVRSLFGLAEQRERYRYDNRGNRIETLAEQDRSSAQIVDGVLHRGAPDIHRWQTRCNYRYDEHGNWTERITLHRQDPNPDFTPSSIERRQIVYFL